jgi:uncharacterized protein (TIGR04255 family)
MAERFPAFDKPPLVETALSVAFAPIEKLAGARVGELWQELRSEFPEIVERPPYEMPVERLGGPPPIPSLELKLTPAISKSRFWMVSEDDQRLVQVQRDFFAYNWRKRGGEEYGGYRAGRESFSRYFTAFSGFLTREGIGSIDPTQCEITYVDHIERDAHSGFSDVFSFAVAPALSAPAAEIEAWQASMAIALRRDGEAFGRIHFAVQPGTSEERPIWSVTSTARGRPLGTGLEGILEFFDLGRQAISLNFVAFTTEEMHKRWGLSWD